MNIWHFIPNEIRQADQENSRQQQHDQGEPDDQKYGPPAGFFFQRQAPLSRGNLNIYITTVVKP